MMQNSVPQQIKRIPLVIDQGYRLRPTKWMHRDRKQWICVCGGLCFTEKGELVEKYRIQWDMYRKLARTNIKVHTLDVTILTALAVRRLVSKKRPPMHQVEEALEALGWHVHPKTISKCLRRIRHYWRI